MRRISLPRSKGFFSSAMLLVLLALAAIVAPPRRAVAEPPPDNEPAAPLPLPFPPGSITETEPFGYLPGSSRVTLQGDFTYAIPLDVPAGRAGMQPDVSLHYSSSGGNGIAGVGWTLDAGLSEITRCNKTVASDGVADGVDFDATDVFCLDGNKLVLASGVYGQDGSEYRTERDTFARIVASGDQAGGPQRFRVWTKDLRIFDYEAVTATRVEGLVSPPYSVVVQGMVRYRWLLRDVHDRSGNAIRYHYTVEQEPEMPFALEVRPSLIEYTRSDSGEGGKRSVLFEYDPRPDTGFWYESGVRTRSTQRLSAIRMYAPNPVSEEEVWSYALTYTESPTTARSRLSSVKRFAKDGGSLWAKDFSWAEAERPSFDIVDVDLAGSGGVTNASDVVLSSVLDIDGDGLDDLLYEVGAASGGTYPFLLLRKSAPGAPLGAGVNLGQTDPSVKAMLFGYSRPGDVDGDGAAEMFMARSHFVEDDPPPGYQLLRFDSAAEVFDPVGPFYPTSPTGEGAYLLDLDGDGRQDLLRVAMDPHHWYLHANSGGNSFGAGEDTGFPELSGFKGRAVDLDGDGRSELLMPILGAMTGDYEAIGLDDDLHPFRTPKLDLPSNAPFKLADLNGDGLRDLVVQGVGNQVEVRYNTGNGFGPTEPLLVVVAISAVDLGDPGVQVADMDGDGREDIVMFSDGPVDRTTANLSRGGGVLKRYDLGVAPGHKADDDSGWTFPKLGDFNGDGLTDIVLIDFESTQDPEANTESIQSWLRILQQRPGASDVIGAVSDEGAMTPRETVTYERIRQETAPADCGYPAHCVRHGLQVVREHQTARQDFPGAVRRHRYSYEEPRVDLRGRGFLGFARVRDFDVEARAETVTEMDNFTEVDGIHPYAGLPAKVTTIVPLLEEPTSPEEAPPLLNGGRATARVTETVTTYLPHWPSPDRYFVAPFAWATTEWEQGVLVTDDSVLLTGAPHPGVRSASGTSFYDDFGNLTVAWSTTLGGTHASISHTYDNLEPEWQIGLLRSRSVVSGAPGQLPPPRVTAFDYDTLGRLHQTIREPDDPALWQSTILRLTSEGLVDKITRSGLGAPSRHVYFAYDNEGVFPRASWNDFAHYARVVHHPALGVAVLREDPNGVQTSATFDGFGRIRSQAPDDGMLSSWSYGADDRATPGVPTGTSVCLTQEDGYGACTYYDDAERAWENEATGFDGTMVVRKRVFNRFGHPSRIHRPGFEGASAYRTDTTFDTLGRPVRVVDPDQATTEIRYDLFETRRWDASGHESYVHHDADGRVDETGHVTDGLTVRTTFTYGPFHQLEHVHDDEGNDTQLDYDHAGRRTAMTDLDLGTTVVEHDGLDQIVTETRPPVSGVPQVRTYGRDALGRIKTITTADGLTKLRYDEGPNARGRLTSATSFDDVETAYEYNDRGQPTVTRWTIGAETYHIERTYDPLGRLSFFRYPEVPGLAKRFEAGPGYNGHGYVASAGEHQQSQLLAALWQVHARNEEGQLTEATFWNGVAEKRDYEPASGRPSLLGANGPDAHLLLGYAYDAVGNVVSRTDAAAGRTETYAYDELDRLTSWTLDQDGASHTTGYVYDRLGNIQDVKVDDVLLEHNDYGQGAGPHALTTRTLAGQPPASYQYDARGRQSHAPSRQVHYSDFDLPRWIATPAGEVTFLYDAFGARVSKAVGAESTTITLGDLYERRATAAGVEHVFYILGDGGPVAEVVYDEASGKKTARAFHRDALGSVALVSENDGTAKERAFYDPFGLRVESDGAPEKDAFSVPLGFTGQRHDDELGLIDMKGRIYDPSLRRFLTADPIVPEPLFGQAYNRYSYVLNNPLRYTDPSGFTPDEWSSESTAQRIQEAANNADSRPRLDDDVVTKNKRRPGTTSGPESSGQPAANGESSDSEGHSAATGATAKPTTADRVLRLAGNLLLRGARNTPVTGFVIRLAEVVGQEAATSGHDDALSIAEIAALYSVKEGTNRPIGWIEGTAHDIATVKDDVQAVGDADSIEDKIDRGLDAAEKIGRIAAVAYGGAKGLRGMIESGGERSGVGGGSGKVTTPYKRPSGATTPAQRASVQGKPCVDCGSLTPTQVADHKTPLVREYYETGTIDKGRMRSLDAVQPQCPTCSARQGAQMSRYSRDQKGP